MNTQSTSKHLRNNRSRNDMNHQRGDEKARRQARHARTERINQQREREAVDFAS